MAVSTSTPVKKDWMKKVRRRKLVLAVLVLLAEVLVCITQIILGVWVSITVENIHAGSYWASVLLLIGAIVSLEGLIFRYGRQKVLAMGVMLQVVGIFMALIGGLIEVIAAILIKDVDFSQCSYSRIGEANCTAQLSCDVVQLSYPKSCYCCFLTKEREEPCYFRTVSFFEPPSLYAGVDSCHQVPDEYLSFLWTSVFFCLFCCVFGIIAATSTYSYRRAPRLPDIAVAAVTSPMLSDSSQDNKTEKSASCSTLDIPIPAPRSSLIRSSSQSMVSESQRPSTPEKASTLPKRQKRRAPDIPGRQSPASSTDSRPSSSCTGSVKPADGSPNISKPPSGSRGRLKDNVSRSSQGSPGPSGVQPQSAVTTPKPTDSRTHLKAVRPKSSIVSPMPSEDVQSSPSRSSVRSGNLFQSHPESSVASEDSQLLELVETSSTRSTPGGASQSCAGTSSPATSLDRSNNAADTSSSPPSGATALPSKTDTKGGAKKKKSHKGPAPQPPTPQRTQTRQLPQLEPLSEPMSPPPPFVPQPPPTPPPSFMDVAPMHYPHHHQPPPHQQPVTNIHLTLTTTPMGANVQIPMTTHQGYMYPSQPSAPCL
ncbi:uncharacterized protein [Diadema antillarum]|uniref:uncharacterized protein n=1 Tax=Diadema antillarum TaxID=105358 RepID=UPI003A84CA35